MSPARILYIASIWIVCSALFRAWRAWKRGTRKPEPPISNAPQRTNTAQAIGSLFVCIAIWDAASIFLQDAAVSAARVLAVSGAAASVIAFALSCLNPDCQLTWKRNVAGYCSLLAGVVIYGGQLFLRSSQPEALYLDYPVHGEWRVITGGRTRLTNYHHDQPQQQNYAVDIVLHGDPAQSLGQPVFAPCVAKVLTVSTQADAPEGNLIVLETSDGTQIWLAHLKENSIQVIQDQGVRAGQQLAEVGATGNAESPHLHIHAQRNNEAVPVRFGAQHRFLVRGDIISTGP